MQKLHISIHCLSKYIRNLFLVTNLFLGGAEPATYLTYSKSIFSNKSIFRWRRTRQSPTTRLPRTFVNRLLRKFRWCIASDFTQGNTETPAVAR